MHEACGIFAAITKVPAVVNAAEITYLGLLGLQHRGQESAGIVVSDGVSNHFRSVKEFGLVNRVFNEAKLQSLSKGVASLGHVRYSTNGSKDSLSSVQPFIVYTQRGIMAIAHNGELSNVKKVRRQLLKNGIGLSTDTDSELIAQLIASHEHADCMMAIRDIMWTLSASYSLVIMLADRLLAVRDPWGNRPLCIGSLAGSGTSDMLAWFVSSESCAFASLPNASLVREVEPGEIVELTAHGITRSVCVSQPNGGKSAFCIFEYIYFARADSIYEGRMSFGLWDDFEILLSGQQVHRARFRCGIKLAKEAPVDADLISTVPSSATPAALGFSQSSGIPYQEVFCKSNYVGRSFIQPFDASRKSSIKQKFSPLVQNYRGCRVVLVDDSIVRGNTMAVLVKLLKQTGASEVHIRIASPPIRNPCHFGINIPTREELLAYQKSLADIKTFLGADSVAYLSIDGLLEVISSGASSKVGNGYCTACFTGVYPVGIDW
ncbi:amidophosphoribosyltransferase [Trichuris trichiura]|uniref:Amidophosphoribosyltransferase n=1 Tax=Trichuris trichiura TaxID=36087 RepID=A0A077Z730_TRITR|nr:amidophosphoribosyltransferase [Trichuris trichiura]